MSKRDPIPQLVCQAMLYRCTLHPKGLNPFQAAKAWHLRKKLKQSWHKIRSQLRTVNGSRPGQDAAEDAVARVEAQRHTAHFRKFGAAKLGYAKCGKKPVLSDAQRKAVVDFVKRWRQKRFCTRNYIIQELKLACKKKTVHRTLNEAGYHWRPVPKKGKLTPEQLAKRKAFVDAHLNKTAAWWRESFGLVLDGVTLTRPPKPLSGKEKHAAQAIKHMWVKDGEALDNSLHTYNRYGVQLGHKVPLWGGLRRRRRVHVEVVDRAAETRQGDVGEAHRHQCEARRFWTECVARQREVPEAAEGLLAAPLDHEVLPSEQRRLEPHRDCLGVASQRARQAGDGRHRPAPDTDHSAVPPARRSDPAVVRSAEAGRGPEQVGEAHRWYAEALGPVQGQQLWELRQVTGDALIEFACGAGVGVRTLSFVRPMCREVLAVEQADVLEFASACAPRVVVCQCLR